MHGRCNGFRSKAKLEHGMHGGCHGGVAPRVDVQFLCPHRPDRDTGGSHGAGGAYARALGVRVAFGGRGGVIWNFYRLSNSFKLFEVLPTFTKII